MKKEEAKEFYPILKAYAEGKVIECRIKPSKMESADTPNGWTEIKEIEFWNNTEYRIKPESKYRPFESAQECIEEMSKHEPFGWVKYKPGFGDKCSAITEVSISSIRIGVTWFCTKEMFQYSTFLDGSPFGVKVEDNEDNHE